ncbi:MAG: hypothetical protein AAF436_09020 [Myxococcota bacterium]
MSLRYGCLVAIIAGSLAWIGCGDDGGGGGSLDPEAVCNTGSCATNDSFFEICVTTFNQCLELDVVRGPEDCVLSSTTVCGVTPAF